MTTSTLQSDVARLIALEDIRALKHKYCLYCDEHYDADRLADLFTETAVWDGGDRGKFEGREQIRVFFSQVNAVFPFAAHLVTNSLIEVDGDCATGLWRMLMPCSIVEAGKEAVSAFQVSRYEERYVRTTAGWKFSFIRVSRSRITLPDQVWDVH